MSDESTTRPYVREKLHTHDNCQFKRLFCKPRKSQVVVKMVKCHLVSVNYSVKCFVSLDIRHLGTEKVLTKVKITPAAVM